MKPKAFVDQPLGIDDRIAVAAQHDLRRQLAGGEHRVDVLDQRLRTRLWGVRVERTMDERVGGDVREQVVSGDQDPPLDLDFQQDAGLAAGCTIQAVVHYGKFPNTFAVYHLTACIYSKSAPETAINCAGAWAAKTRQVWSPLA